MEAGIRTTEALNQEITARLSTIQSDIKHNRWYRRMLAKKNRGKLVRYSLLASNALLLVVVVAFVAQNPQTGSSGVSNAILNTSNSEEVVSPLDALSSADIAVNIAKTAGLPETSSVSNKADTVNAQLAIAPSDNIVAAKPQVIATALKSRADIQFYTVVKGDTVPTIAEKFGVTSDTIRWSNDLDGDTVDVGTKLVISPIDGIAYKVRPGESVDEIISKYRVDKGQVVIFNDIETGGLPVGQYIILPSAKPAAVAATPSVENVASTGSFAWGGFSAQYDKSNGYDYGYCTWYVKNRRPELPNNLGNASTWKILAQRAGLSVGNSPRAGAVIWTPPRDYYGHVGYVEKVNSDGSVEVSEMNTAGFGVLSRKKLSASQAAAYGYIY